MYSLMTIFAQEFFKVLIVEIVDSANLARLSNFFLYFFIFFCHLDLFIKYKLWNAPKDEPPLNFYKKVNLLLLIRK